MADIEDLEDAAIDLLLYSSLMLLAADQEESTSDEECVKRIRLSSSSPCEKQQQQQSATGSKKRLWVKEWREKKQFCEYSALITRNPSVQQTHSYRNYIRMDEQVFNEILAHISDDIRRQSTVMRSPVAPDQKLSITLRFLATGESLNALNYATGYSNKFLSEAVMEVCNAICHRMQDDFLKFPDTKQEWINEANKFSTHWNFPHCLGALDCKHIQFIPPKRERDSLFVEKAFNSITLLVLADSDCRFTFVDIGRHGTIKDEEVLERSHLIHIIRQGQEHLPADSVVGQQHSLPYVFIADEAFPLEKHLMKPYSDPSSSQQKQCFNARLNHARQCVERALAILCNRFRVLQTKIFLNHRKVQSLVLCCCILHNFLMEKSTWYREQVLSQDEKDAIDLLEVTTRKKPSQSLVYGKIARPIRDSFANCLLAEG